MPELAIQAAQRLAQLGGSAEQVRQWLLPVWQHMVDLPNAWPNTMHSNSSRRWKRACKTWTPPGWPVSTGAAGQPARYPPAVPGRHGLRPAPAVGQGQQLLTQAAPNCATPVCAAPWRKLATLAEQRPGDAQAAAQAWKNAALAD